MGCGLSQISRSQRVRVWDISSSSRRSIATTVDITTNVDTGEPLLRPPVEKLSRCNDQRDTDNIIVLEELKDSQKQHDSDSLHAEMRIPIRRGTLSLASITTTKLMAEMAIRPDTSNFGSLPRTSIADKGRSSVSVKSFSDHDSGYKDDSQPEGEDGRVSTSPWNERRIQCPIQFTSSDSITINDNGSALKTFRDFNLLDVKDEDFISHQTSGQQDQLVQESPVTMTLCSCGYSHTKQDGYVETYEDGTYLDSSYEELRSLAHEGSVFSIDILCHTSMDGSHRAHKVPLYVHKPGSATYLHTDRNMTTTHAATTSFTNYNNRLSNTLDFQYHFHLAHAQVNNQHLKSYDAGDSINVFNRSSSLSNTTGFVVKRRHVSTSGLPSQHMITQLNSYANFLAHQSSHSTHKAGQEPSSEDEIQSLQDE